MLFDIDIKIELYSILIYIIVCIIFIYSKETITHIYELLKEINDKISNHDKLIDDINNKISNHDKSFEDINNKISKHDKSLENINNKISKYDKSMDNINNKISNHDKLINDINSKISDYAKLMDNINNKISNHDKSMDNINNKISNHTESIDDINNTISNHTELIDDINNRISYHTESIDDINNKISDHDKLFEDINNYPDLIIPSQIISSQKSHNYDHNQFLIHCYFYQYDNTIFKGAEYGERYQIFSENYKNLMIDIKNIQKIKFELKYYISKDKLIFDGIIIYINEIPILTGYLSCMYDMVNEHTIRENIINDQLNHEYYILYKIFSKIFLTCQINEIYIAMVINNKEYYPPQVGHPYHYHKRSIKCENILINYKKKIYDNLILKLCNLYQVKLNIYLPFSDGISNIFKLDDILLAELNYNNISNINFNNFNSKMQEYIKKNLNSDIFKKCRNNISSNLHPLKVHTTMITSSIFDSKFIFKY